MFNTSFSSTSHYVLTRHDVTKHETSEWSFKFNLINPNLSGFQSLRRYSLHLMTQAIKSKRARGAWCPLRESQLSACRGTCECPRALLSHEINGSRVEGKSKRFALWCRQLSGGQGVYFSEPFTWDFEYINPSLIIMKCFFFAWLSPVAVLSDSQLQGKFHIKGINV